MLCAPKQKNIRLAMHRKTWQQKWDAFLVSKYPAIIWFTLAFVSALSEVLRGATSINNYLIFKGVFWHTIHQQNLYAQYPESYFDANHYGPLFSAVIAPFALLPNWLGALLWTLANAFVLYKAIEMLPLLKKQKNAVLLIALIEMATSAHNLQFNAAIAAAVIAAYTYTKRGKEIWACLFIVLGFYVKLYGIVGAVFWLFSSNKLKFIGYMFFWMLILFALPMLLSSPAFIIQSYQDWYHSLVEKNIQNVTYTAQSMQDISVMGMVKRVFNLHNLSNLIVIAPGLLLYGAALLKIKSYSNQQFQMLSLASTLLFLVLFSTGSESATYIIAVVGASIWFVLFMPNMPNWAWALLIFVLLFTSLSATDVVPRIVKVKFIRPYALKALPCFVVWLCVVYQMISGTFALQKTKLQSVS